MRYRACPNNVASVDMGGGAGQMLGANNFADFPLFQSMPPRLVLLIAGIATFVLMGAGQALYGPALPAFARSFDLTVAEAGWMVSAQWIGAAVGVGLMFAAAHLFGPRHALLKIAGGAVIIALTPYWAGALAGSLIFGIGYGIATVVFNPRILSEFGDRGPSMVSLVNAMFAAGAIVSPLVYVGIGSNPALAFGGLAVLALLIALLAKVDKADAAAVTENATEPYRFAPLILTFGIIGIAIEATLIGLGPTALIRAGYSEVAAAQGLSVFFVVFLVARLVLVWLAHYFRPFSLFTAAMAIMAALALAGTVLPPMVFFAGMGISAGLFFPNFFVVATRAMGNNPKVTPTIVSAGLVGGISAPVVIGSLIEGLGDRGYFQIMAAIALPATLAALAVMRRINQA